MIEYANTNNLKLYQVFAFQETDDKSIHYSPPIPLALPRSNAKTQLDLTPLVKLIDIKFGFSFGPQWVRPEIPSNKDVEEVH